MLIIFGNEITELATAWSSLQTKESIVENQLHEMMPFHQVEVITAK